MKYYWLIVGFFLSCLMTTTCWAGLTINEIKAMSLAEVMDLPIETSSKKMKKQFNESASTYVITQEDISRSGVTSLPEALRLAPGVHVARISANQWAISIHGFNERFSNKLLVLIDGRSVYSPLFSGVYWDAQDVRLENVKRIEVVRGSGTALWGSNAVNGVINVITYSAKETQGVEATAGYGTEEQGFGSLRYGGALGEKTHYRIHGKGYNRDEGGAFNQHPANDHSLMSSGGFRIDTDFTKNHSLMFAGDAYAGEMGQAGYVRTLNNPPNYSELINDNVRLNGENVLARWTNQEEDRKNWALQAYFDHTSRQDSVLGNQAVSVTDLDFQRHFGWLSNHEIGWGLQYRYVNNELDPGILVSLNPTKRNTRLFSGFLSDEISLFQDQFKFNLASRFEHNDFTGFEIQPTARMTWLVNERNTLWGAVSRSVKVPSISDQNSTIQPGIRNVGIPLVINIAGNNGFSSERLISYELGYRVQPSHEIQLDIATFFNDYDQLRTFEQKDVFFLPNPSRLIFPYEFDNKMRGHTYGLDLSAKWYINSWWHIDAGYSYAKTVLHLKNGSTDTVSLSVPVFANAPEQMASLRSAWDVRENWNIDLWMRYVDKLQSTYVNAYVTMDARLAWKASRNIELSLVGQNLLDNQQLQFFQDTATQLYSSEVQRGVYFKVKLDL